MTVRTISWTGAAGAAAMTFLGALFIDALATMQARPQMQQVQQFERVVVHGSRPPVREAAAALPVQAGIPL